MYELPEHLLIPVDDMGRGPVDDAEAHRLVCWCPKGAGCRVVWPRWPRKENDDG
jgi:hypothetical protein